MHKIPFLLLLLLLLLLLAAPALAQSRFDVTGFVTDSTDTGLSGATVVVLQQADSSLVGFGVTRANGAFRVGRVPSGSYLLQVTFVGFAPYAEPIAVADASLDVGRIRLTESVAGIDELVITADRIPMVVKKDTLEYNAAAFPVRPNANVEELLKRLPGIEVERDGSITAQGESVRKVLVDGKEFFGNDPTVATRNLPADAVEKVQVYDKKSDMAEFTGMDDGEDEKTINLALKEDRRRGTFGNLTAGLGDGMRYEGRGSVNRFSSTTQFSMIGNINNVNQQSFGIGEYVSFMGGVQNMAGAGGRIALGGAPIGTDVATGFSTTLSGGINFNRDFTPRTSLRASYMAYYLDNDQDRSVLQHQISGASAAALTRQDVDQTTQNLNHRINLNLRHAFSDGHDVRLRSNIVASDADLDNRSGREMLDASGILRNTSETAYNSTTDAVNADATLTYRKRFAPGRSFVAELRSGINDRDLSADLGSINRFFQQGSVLTSEEIAQLQAQLSNTLTHSEKLTYSEPLGRRQLLQFELGHRGVLEDQEKTFFNNLTGSPVRDDALSSAFDRTYRYYTGGVNFRRAAEPLTVRVGVEVQQSHLAGAIRGIDADVDRRFVHVLPSASAEYAFAQSKNLNLRYRATTREPSMRDLQPFAENDDPLNVYVGNPDLRPEYNHAVDLHFMLFDPFSFLNVFAFARAGYTLDKIVRDRTIDEQFRQRATSANADGDWSLSGSISLGTPIRRLGAKVNVSTQSVYNRGMEFLNGEENGTRILRSTWDLRLENRDKGVVDAMAGARYTFNDARYALNPAMNRSYVNRTFYSELSYRFAGAWRVMTALDYNLYSGEVFGSARHVPLLRAELSRTLMNDRVEVKLVGLDLLDRSEGVNYSNTSTYIQEERINSLGRYVMLKAVYSLSGTRRPEGMMRVIGG